MSAALATPRLRARHLAWLPAVMLVAWGILAAAGVPLTPSAPAASTGSSTVVATVDTDIHINGTCAAGTTFPTVALAVGENTLASCGVTWGTNNGTTSTLKVESARDNTGQAAFCVAADGDVNCGASFTAPGVNAASLTGGQFGVLTTAITSCTTQTWTLNTYNAVPNGFDQAGSGTTICSMTGTTDGNYTLSFRANRAASTAAGTYRGQAIFTAEAT